MRRILGKVEEKRGMETSEVRYHMGQPVKVIDGPFSGFGAQIKEINEDKQKLKVEVSIFGRKTPVELDYTQVEPDIFRATRAFCLHFCDCFCRNPRPGLPWPRFLDMFSAECGPGRGK